MEQSVPKRRHIKFRRRGITQKKHTTFRTRQKFEIKIVKAFRVKKKPGYGKCCYLKPRESDLKFM